MLRSVFIFSLPSTMEEKALQHYNTSGSHFVRIM